MPANIATQKARKARPGIARRPIGHPYRNSPDLQQPHNFFASTTFSTPVAGRWKFVGWGPGGIAATGFGGGSGGYFEITRQLPPLARVTINVGLFNTSDTSVVFPDATSATATRAVGATGGTASGGDVNLSGTAGVATGGTPGLAGLGTGGGAGGAAGGALSGGAGAPANLPFRGSPGGPAAVDAGPKAGPGSGSGEEGSASNQGTNGMVIACLIND